MKKIHKFLRIAQAAYARISDSRRMHEDQLLATGKLLSWQCQSRKASPSLANVEFKVFSQFGDDGIIQWLIHHLDIPNKTFIEFGVENYRESNTRFLMMNDNWSGFVMDGSEKSVSEIVRSEYYWRHDITAKCAFIDEDNINTLISSAGFSRDLGLLHVDLDGNDYWIWKKINVVDPIVVIVEYNSVLGSDRPITVPYDKSFFRTEKHYSNLYWGSSLPALCLLAEEKGYAFIGCNGGGNNAYFVRRDSLNDFVTETTIQKGFVCSKYREGRDRTGQLTYLAGESRAAEIRGMPVHDALTNRIEPF